MMELGDWRSDWNFESASIKGIHGSFLFLQSRAMPIAFITESLATGFNREENQNITLREDYIHIFLVPIGHKCSQSEAVSHCLCFKGWFSPFFGILFDPILSSQDPKPNSFLNPKTRCHLSCPSYRWREHPSSSEEPPLPLQLPRLHAWSGLISKS